MKKAAFKSTWQKPIWFSATAASILLAITGFGTTAMASDLEAGKKAYERSCQACHRPDGSFIERRNR